MQQAENSAAESDEIVILHVFPSFAFGGQQTRLAQTALRLGRRFRHVIAAIDGDFSARAQFSDTVRAAFMSLPLKKASSVDFTNLMHLRNFIRETAPDILCTYNWGSIEAALANRLFEKKPHVHFEDGFGGDAQDPKVKRRRDSMRRFALRRATILIPTTALKETARNNWRAGSAPVIQISNGVDFNAFQSAPGQLRDKIVVGSVGALRPEKNYARLIEAFLAADATDKARLVIYGDGPERGALLDLIKRRDAASRIQLPGAIANPAKAYAEFDFFALSSDTEQAPISIMEAMASGLAIVAPNVGEIGKMVTDENRAYITPQGDDNAYREALSHLLQNPSARADVGAANRRHARMEFSADATAEQIRAVLMKALGREEPVEHQE